MKTKVINISLPEALLENADEIASQENRNRSELFREALRNYVLRKELDIMYRYGKQKAREQNIKPENIEGIIQETRKK